MGNSVDKEQQVGKNPQAQGPAGSTDLPQVWKGLLKPPEERGLILKVLLPEHWQQILVQVRPRDLLSLARASRDLQAVVLDFARHHVETAGRRERLERVLEGREEMPLLIQEVALVQKLKDLGGVERLRSSPTLIHMKAARALCSVVSRARVRHCEDFPHLGNPHYIPEDVYQPELDRGVVVLLNVCWLYFRKEFAVDRPGRYELALRMSLSKRLRWPDHGGRPGVTYVRALVADGEEDPVEKVCQEVAPAQWNALARRRLDLSALTNASVTFDPPGSDWLYFRLAPFTVGAAGRVSFEFRDVDNPFWKEGMKWDFIQLRRIE